MGTNGGGGTTLLHHASDEELVVDETLQHHHQAPRPLTQRALGVLLQEGKELRSDLGQHGGHVVSCQWVAMVQIHHCILQVAEQGHRGSETSDNEDIRRLTLQGLSTVSMRRKYSSTRETLMKKNRQT